MFHSHGSKHVFSPMDCSLPGSSVHGIPQARILERVAMPSSRGIFPTQRLNCVSHISWIAGGFFTTELLEKPSFNR